MAEQEPKVAPIIRLPQLRGGRRTQSSRAFETTRQPDKEGSDEIPEEAEAEEGAEDEEAFNQPLKTQVSGDQTRLGDTATLRGGHYLAGNAGSHPTGNPARLSVWAVAAYWHADGAGGASSLWHRLALELDRKDRRSQLFASHWWRRAGGAGYAAERGASALARNAAYFLALCAGHSRQRHSFLARNGADPLDYLRIFYCSGAARFSFFLSA